MKILKLLNRKNLSIFIIIFLLFSLNLEAEDKPEDIWDLEKKLEKTSLFFKVTPLVLINKSKKCRCFCSHQMT